MANVQFRCSCGFMFVVNEAQLGKTGKASCPSCLRPVLLDGPGPETAPRKTARVLTAAPDASKMRMWVMVLGAGAAVLVGVIILLLVVTGDDTPSRERARYDFREAPAASGGVGRMPAPPPPPPSVNVGSPPTSGVTGSAASAFPPQPPPPPPPPAPLPAGSSGTVGSAVQPGAAAPGAAPLPAELLQQVRDGVLALHPFYQSLALPGPDKSRIEYLAKTGMGTADDVTYLRALLGGKIKAALDERASIVQNLERLQKEALEGLPVDRLVMSDGRIMPCRVLEETPEAVKIERKMAGGVGGTMNFRKETLRAVEKGRGPGGEFKTKWDSASKGAVPELAGLATWCRENSMTLQLQLVAHKILAADPGHAASRADAGLAADPIARAVEAEKQGGFISYDGRSWTPRELKEKLIRDGRFLQEGQWYAKKDRMISVPGLFRYERQTDKPVLISGSVPLSHEQVVSYTAVQDVSSNSFVEKEEIKNIRRFYAPTLGVRMGGWSQGSLQSTIEVEVQGKEDKPDQPIGSVLTGEVFITVPVGEPILEASVMTAAEVKPGSSIVVSLIHNAERIRLYACGAKEDDLHKLPDAVKGKTQVDLVAAISMKSAYTAKVERRRVRGLKKNNANVVIQKALDVVHHRLIPDYHAMLFPSNSNTIEVFRLKVTTGEPLPAVTKLFANAPPELLKTP
jgi:hypothetical protein